MSIGREEATLRLEAANKRMGETAHLPPGDEDRDAAVLELRNATCLADEWMLLPSRQGARARHLRERGAGS